jgi:hypothetical protein
VLLISGPYLYSASMAEMRRESREALPSDGFHALRCDVYFYRSPEFLTDRATRHFSAGSVSLQPAFTTNRTHCTDDPDSVHGRREKKAGEGSVRPV